jgi:hypothetical protein
VASSNRLGEVIVVFGFFAVIGLIVFAIVKVIKRLFKNAPRVDFSNLNQPEEVDVEETRTFSERPQKGALTQEALTESHNLLPNAQVIRSIVYDTAINRATIVLLFWGLLNLGIWAVWGTKDVKFLLGLRNPGQDIYMLAYGGVFIGGIMLLFAIIGAISKHIIVGYLSGLSLIFVGLWNISHDFFTNEVLRPYGYHVKEFSIFWIMLGVAQLIWGFREMGTFSRLGAKPETIDDVEKNLAKAELKNIIKAPREPLGGKLAFTIQRRALFLPQVDHYVMLLLPDRALCLHKGLHDYFEVDRNRGVKWLGDKGSVKIMDDNQRSIKISMPQEDIGALERWASGSAASSPANKALLGSQKCPSCGKGDVYRAYIEDGSMGDWCPNCKRSLQSIQRSK